MFLCIDIYNRDVVGAGELDLGVDADGLFVAIKHKYVKGVAAEKNGLVKAAPEVEALGKGVAFG